MGRRVMEEFRRNQTNPSTCSTNMNIVRGRITKVQYFSGSAFAIFKFRIAFFIYKVTSCLLGQRKIRKDSPELWRKFHHAPRRFVFQFPGYSVIEKIHLIIVTISFISKKISLDDIHFVLNHFESVLLNRPSVSINSLEGSFRLQGVATLAYLNYLFIRNIFQASKCWCFDCSYIKTVITYVWN